MPFSAPAAIPRARITKHGLEELTSLSKAADPGNLKRHKDWIIWYKALKNYPSTILGQYGVPLSFMIKESAAPDYTIDSPPDFDFELLSVNCGPLNGLTFKTYYRKLHQLIHGFIHIETT